MNLSSFREHYSDPIRLRLSVLLLLGFTLPSVVANAENEMPMKTFGRDLEFLQLHMAAVVLKDDSGKAQIAVSPAYQGRVMTSTAKGPDGTSFGWINYEYIEAGKVTPQINVPGGEERFWLGPEGGQFSLFFAPGSKFVFDDWQTPSPIVIEPFEIFEQSQRHAKFVREMSLRNYSGTEFNLRVDRRVEILSRSAASKSLGHDLENWISLDIALQTGLRISERKPGLMTKVSCRFGFSVCTNQAPKLLLSFPSNMVLSTNWGRLLTMPFGKVPAERLKIEDDVLFFAGDGIYRSKIGVSPKRSKGICGSYDAQGNVLTIVKYNMPRSEVTDYVNSMWHLQDEPFAADAVNAYNDGPSEAGAKALGPFYELETSSPALALKPGESGVHIQETYHFEGDERGINALAMALLGRTLGEIVSASE